MGKLTMLCVQLGAREHYAVPRALETVGREVTLVTDLWAGNSCGGWMRRLGRGADRFHQSLRGEVISWNRAALVWELGARLAWRRGWKLTEARNRWFQRKVAGFLSRRSGEDSQAVFAYSYCALDALQWAREWGVPGLLGQIDPGPVEERLVRQLENDCGSYPSPGYWAHWRREVDVASTIVVNSDWSRRCLVEEGIGAERLAIIPLAFESTTAYAPRTIPECFSAEVPLRVLFLGQVIARKGVVPLLAAMEMLASENVPVVLDLVGGGDALLLARAMALPNCRVHGPCRRSDAVHFYRDADVFVLPTFSDGFALTQLEALAAGMPVIASKNCGDVVRDGINGLLLDRVDASTIAHALRCLVCDPQILSRWVDHSLVESCFGLEAVGRTLSALLNAGS